MFSTPCHGIPAICTKRWFAKVWDNYRVVRAPTFPKKKRRSEPFPNTKDQPVNKKRLYLQLTFLRVEFAPSAATTTSASILLPSAIVNVTPTSFLDRASTITTWLRYRIGLEEWHELCASVATFCRCWTTWTTYWSWISSNHFKLSQNRLDLII